MALGEQRRGDGGGPGSLAGLLGSQVSAQYLLLSI